MTDQYVLCKTQAEIDAIQQTNDLIRVNATATRAALHPSWPQTLVSLAICAYTLATARSIRGRIPEFLESNDDAREVNQEDDNHANPTFGGFLFVVLIPFIVVVHWTVSYFEAKDEGPTGGWVSMNFVPGITLCLGLGLYLYDHWKSKSIYKYGAAVLLLPALALMLIQFGGTGGLVTARNEFYGIDISTLAYNITDANGCTSYNGSFSYLEQGTRYSAFQTIQAVEFWWSLGCLFVLFLTSIVFMAKEYKQSVWRYWSIVFAYINIVIIIPVFFYEVYVAVAGTPVVISGDCMLVELNPNVGFMDSTIDPVWKYLVTVTGL